LTTNIGDGRALRVCDLCGGVDDHPRHVLSGNVANIFPIPSGAMARRVMANAAHLPEAEQDRLLAELVDTASSDRHLDCCAAAGCPTNTCGLQVVDAPGTGAAMLEHLTSIKDRFADRPDVVKAV